MQFWKFWFAAPFLAHVFHGGFVVRDSLLEEDYLLASYILTCLGALGALLIFVLHLLGSCEPED